MTNILTISTRWNSPQFKGLAHSAERRTSRHVFLPSLNAVLATVVKIVFMTAQAANPVIS